jgi:hypothetical protein
MTRISKTSAPADANPDASATPPVVASDLVSAVLLSALDNIRSGVVVQGVEDRIAPLIASGQARAASATDIAVAGVNIRVLD